MAVNILALETSADACSVAVYSERVLVERHEVAPRRHTELIFALIDEALEEARIDRKAIDLVAFGRGPGSFTGVRIAASVAQGIAFAHDLPVAPVSTLFALAAGAARLFDAAKVVTVTDARRKEIYTAAYELNEDLSSTRVVDAERVIAPEDFRLPATADWVAVGNGWKEYENRFAPAMIPPRRPDLPHPRARDVARIAAIMYESGQSVAPRDALPVYLRKGVD